MKKDFKLLRAIYTYLIGPVILLVAGCFSESSQCDITVGQAKAIIDQDKNITVVDVREAGEYTGKMGHVPGALNYPWTSGYLQKHYQELPREGKILVICHSGRRSKAATRFLKKNNFPNVFNILGGTQEWHSAGFKTQN